jgi:hypothetical protein
MSAPMPPAARLLFVLAAMSLVAWTIVAVVHVAPSLARWSRRDALLVVLTPQMFRHVGALALFPGIGATPPEWSVPLAWGDAATSMLAALAMTALYREWPAAIPLAWAATVFGALDLLHNGFNAAHLGVAPSLGPIVYVVVIAVPGMLTAHVLALRVLLRSA